jgi:hypothetical protein
LQDGISGVEMWSCGSAAEPLTRAVPSRVVKYVRVYVYVLTLYIYIYIYNTAKRTCNTLIRRHVTLINVLLRWPLNIVLVMNSSTDHASMIYLSSRSSGSCYASVVCPLIYTTVYSMYTYMCGYRIMLFYIISRSVVVCT